MFYEEMIKEEEKGFPSFYSHHYEVCNEYDEEEVALIEQRFFLA